MDKQQEEIEEIINEELRFWNGDINELPEWFRIRCIEFYERGKQQANQNEIEFLKEVKKESKRKVDDSLSALAFNVWIVGQFTDRLNKLIRGDIGGEKDG